MKRIIGGTLFLVAIAIVAVAYRPTPSSASDHDDGLFTDLKSPSLNLTDHFAFKSPQDATELSLITYFNPRGLPSKQYFMSPNARYEQHVTKIAARADAATGKDDFVFRFEAAAPNAGGVQQVKLTVLKDMGGTLTEVGSMMGNTTDFANSKANTVTTNTGSVGGITVKWFIGQRADSFHFDVVRYFQVRSFLADRFFGGNAANKGNAGATLANNCRGDQFLALGDATKEVQPSDGDVFNLWNPPSCASDFTKNLNVTAIVLNVKIAELGGTIFDTWSTISVLQ
jgi:hypothetical protein